MRCETLTDEDKATLCAFVACAHFRTRRSREHWKRQLGRAVELGDRIKAHVESLSSEEKAALENLSMPASGPTFSLEDLRQAAEQPLQNMLPTVTEREAEFLFYMRMTIFCTSNHTGFITSDAPVVLVDPELHKMPPFYRKLALGSPTIEVTMPIAPSRLVLFTHNEKPRGLFSNSLHSSARHGFDRRKQSSETVPLRRTFRVEL
jgi:hypothetical protein